MVYHRMKYRHLGVKSSHRQALLRNLVTSLIEHESITTSYAKAKEAQRFAEKLISLGKRNTEAARNRAKGILFRPVELMPKLFGPLRERYASRPGGYTRVLRMESHKEDMAPSAILELVDGQRDMRFMMTAKTIASERASGRQMNDRTAVNVQKVTQFRPDGEAQLERLVAQIEGRKEGVEPEAIAERRKMGELKEKVYAGYDILRKKRINLRGTNNLKKEYAQDKALKERAAGK